LKTKKKKMTVLVAPSIVMEQPHY